MKVRLISSDSTMDLTQGTDYNVSDRVVTLTNPTSLKIQIYRETTTKPLVGWADASVLRAADMTVQSTQLLHLSEETMDKVQDGGLAQDTNDGVWDARYNRIKNLLDPKEPGDAVTLSYIVANQTSLINALKATGKEQNDSIVSTGNTQNTRLTTTGDTQNKRLTNTGDSYVNTMTTLKNTATTKANDASNSAELSKKWAVSDTSPDGATDSKSSKTWAENAKESASSSASSASASASSAAASQTSASSSASSASTASQKATDSANSATESATSASNAATSATNAKTSETNAAASATAAAQSAENAKLWDNTNYYTKSDIDTKINGIFMEKRFIFTNKSVPHMTAFKICEAYNIHVDGYKPLAFAEVYWDAHCTIEDHYWDENDRMTLWGFNFGAQKDIKTSLYILYVKESFR